MLMWRACTGLAVQVTILPGNKWLGAVVNSPICPWLISMWRDGPAIQAVPASSCSGAVLVVAESSHVGVFVAAGSCCVGSLLDAAGDCRVGVLQVSDGSCRVGVLPVNGEIIAIQ